MVRVAVVGAGAAGLAAAKACLEAGLDCVILEQSGTIGGLWYFKEEATSGQASVMKTTVINSSKEMSAFSDFPPPSNTPNYMHHRLLRRYLLSYAEAFHLQPLIRYHQEVVEVAPASDYEATGRWTVSWRDVRAQRDSNASVSVHRETFEGVLLCTGHHGHPHSPHFPGQEEFVGKVMHSHALRQADGFKDQRVAVIGVGNSGLDAAVDLSSVAKQVTLSTRRGTWIMFRLGSNGLPVDTQLLTRGWYTLNSIFGQFISSTFIENYLDSKFDHELYNLRPKHRFYAQHLAINDHLPNKILSGTVMIKGDVDRFCEKGIVFKGDETVTKLDAVILATGYKIKYPFISDKIINTANNKVELYKLMFPPGLKHPTLAVIGLVQPFGSLFPIMEMQARWYAQLMKGNVSLPSEKCMWDDIRSRNKNMSSRYVGTQRHTVQVDYVTYMDEISSQFGAKPNMFRMAISDPKLFYHCFFGPCTPYQYRLQGPDRWPEARSTILATNKRILAPLDTRHGKNYGGLMEKYFNYATIRVSLILAIMWLGFFLFCR